MFMSPPFLVIIVETCLSQAHRTASTFGKNPEIAVVFLNNSSKLRPFLLSCSYIFGQILMISMFDCCDVFYTDFDICLLAQMYLSKFLVKEHIPALWLQQYHLPLYLSMGSLLLPCSYTPCVLNSSQSLSISLEPLTQCQELTHSFSFLEHQIPPCTC